MPPVVLGRPRAPGRSKAYFAVVFTECKLQLAPHIEVQRTQKLNGYADLSNLRQGTRSVPHHSVRDHLFNLAYLLFLLELLDILVTIGPPSMPASGSPP